MADREERDPGLHLLGTLGISLLLWWSAEVVVMLVLNAEPRSAAIRGLAVALGITGFLVWVHATILAIRAQDEFKRQMHLVALGVAFAGSNVFILAVDLLQRANFMSWLSMTTVWMAMLVIWWLSIFVTGRFYR